MAPRYAQVAATVELASTDIDATNAAAISAAVAAKATEVGDTRAWWAYLADADGNKVDENGTQIIIQCDTCTDYRFYNVSATGCTIAHITWGDMPENSNYWRGERGYYNNYWGVMNIAKTKAWATGSGRVPTQNEPVGPRAGNDAPVKPSEFATSQYCADLRAAYGSYEEYLEKCYAVVCPQKYGCFALPDGAAMAERYARKTAPTKDGGTKYKYPALYYGYNRTYGVDGLDYGDWHLPGVLEGTQLMKDACLAALAPSITKMGTTAINNSTHRWWAARYSVLLAWIFNAGYGALYYYSVDTSNRCQAITLLDLDKI
jgi:nitrite reductase/ring-hydroxylating ferredoxin subunit